MTTSETPELPEVPGLDSLEEGDRARVLEVGRRVHIPSGWSMMHQSEPADEAYLVLEGSLRVEANDRHVATIRPGGFAGEMVGLVDRRLRSALVTTEGDVTALAFPREDFERLRRELPAFEALVVESTELRRETV